MKTAYQATKVRSSRPGWSVTFKHPKRSDSRSRPGLKIRKGLGTQDDEEAERLVDQLNELLNDEHWWTVDRRKEAETRFDPVVVKIFFEGMESGKVSSAHRREELMVLPGAEDGYSRILFTGTTGAGKSTLLRHVIGSNHHKDRFPSISTARTTTADIEIVTSEGPFEAVVTFMPEHEVRAHVDECLEEACLRVVQGQPEPKVMGAILTHREQRFRLSYVLGGWDQKVSQSSEEEFSFDEEDAETEVVSEREAVTIDEIAANRTKLENYMSRIKEIAREVGAWTAESLGEFHAQEGPEEKAAWLEIFGDALHESGTFPQLALDIMEEVENRFGLVTEGEFKKGATGWPEVWTFTSEDRENFLRQVRWFSSNHHAQFGKLLTPLVDGVRVRGPFLPALEYLQVAPKLVLLDGEGIGHTAKAGYSISTRITRRFTDVDLILIVDNAEQPMQTAPLELLRSIGSSGHADKLALAFTHFDLVKGANLGSHQQKCEHVLNSVRDAIGSLRQSVGATVASLLESRIEDYVFYIGGLDREISKIPRGFQIQLHKLLTVMKDAGVPAAPVEAAPIYSGEGLEIALRDAVEGFLAPWKARLGKGYHNGIASEHWTRVKALSRRFAMAWANEYDDLRPVADLVARLQENISLWLDNPADWTRIPIDEKERIAALGKIRKAVFTALHDLVEDRMADRHRPDWTTAFEYSGRGSGYDRADKIQRIYEDAAPQISSAMSEPARAFLHTLHRIVRKAVDEAGGQFRIEVGSAV